jgi:hypothetical protein
MGTGWGFTSGEKRLLWAVAVALAIGVAATGAGALLHREEGRSCGEGGRDCVYYDYYGWPWEWGTSAPDWVIQRTLENSECGSFCYNEEGYSGGIFLFTTAMWTLAALVAEGLFAVIAYGVGRLLVRRERVASV